MAFNRDRNSRSGGDSPRFGGGAGRGGFRPRPRFGDSPRFGGGAGRPRFDSREDRGPVEMHSAVCDNCNRECEVPFRPTSGKPVYCSNCFENQRGNSDSGNSGRYERRNFERPRDEQRSPASQDKFAEINVKLDNILRLLESQKPVEKERKPVKKTKVEEVTPTIEE